MYVLARGRSILVYFNPFLEVNLEHESGVAIWVNILSQAVDLNDWTADWVDRK